MLKKTTLALFVATFFLSTNALALSDNTITFQGKFLMKLVLSQLMVIRQNLWLFYRLLVPRS